MRALLTFTLEFFSTLCVFRPYASSVSRLMTSSPLRTLSNNRFSLCHSLRLLMSCTHSFLVVSASLRPEGRPWPPGLIKELLPSLAICAQLMAAVLLVPLLPSSAAGLAAKCPPIWQFWTLNVIPSPVLGHCRQKSFRSLTREFYSTSFPYQ